MGYSWGKKERTVRNSGVISPDKKVGRPFYQNTAPKGETRPCRERREKGGSKSPAFGNSEQFRTLKGGGNQNDFSRLECGVPIYSQESLDS